MIKKIAVLTSGGDAPGMNAAVRAVVRTALENDVEVYGIYDGYLGMHQDRIEKLERHHVSETINRGGTFLGSARFVDFKKPEVIKEAVANLTKHGIEALVVVGGDGSFMGAKDITELGFPCIGIPGTIDNDVAGTDFTIGFYTALNTILDAIDRLRDTCSSHNRISILEVMGRHCGDLTVQAALAGGAEYALVPERPWDEKELIESLKADIKKGKKHAIITVTEQMTDCNALATRIEEATGLETRATILGHTQRGGAPSAFDRILASRMGAYSVSLLLEGEGGRCVGVQNGQLVHHDIVEAIKTMAHPFNDELYDLSQKLS